jgi:2-methylisocitrate lyase-like PEP mutase family enzyme
MTGYVRAWLSSKAFKSWYVPESSVRLRRFNADLQYMSGAMTTAARLGKADLAFASLNDFALNGQMIANIDPRVPLIADADTGFGSPPNIARMVQVYHQSGIAGFHIEDQVMNKRCGHLKGKQLVDLE